MEKLLYRPSEAKAALGVGIHRIYHLINAGTLEARRFGKRTFITAASLEAFAASLKPVVTPTMAKVGQETPPTTIRFGGRRRASGAETSPAA